MNLSSLLPERLFTWWQVGRKDGMLCMAYGGTMASLIDHEGSFHPGRVLACGKRRRHFGSHTCEFLDVLEAQHERPSRA